MAIGSNDILIKNQACANSIGINQAPNDIANLMLGSVSGSVFSFDVAQNTKAKMHRTQR